MVSSGTVVAEPLLRLMFIHNKYTNSIHDFAISIAQLIKKK